MCLCPVTGVVTRKQNVYLMSYLSRYYSLYIIQLQIISHYVMS